MNRRFLLIDANGETILATLTMSGDDAELAVKSGQTLLAIDPGTDDGARINDAAFKVSMTGGDDGGPALVPIDPGYTGLVPESIQLSAYVAV